MTATRPRRSGGPAQRPRSSRQRHDLVEGDRRERGLEPLKAEDYRVREEDVARWSPLSYEHTNRLARYAFTWPDPVASGSLRPLRNPNHLLENAA
jgi:hypothetical protein